MKDKQRFIEEMDLQQDADGHWYVNGNVEGDVWGNVGGNVWGSVKGRKWKFVEENNGEP